MYQKKELEVDDTTELLPYAQMLSLQAFGWWFNVIISDILHITMHTYALPDATLRSIAMLFFYRSAYAFNRTLLCHKRNNSA